MTEESRRGRPDDEDIDARFAEIVAGLDLSDHPDDGPEGDAERPTPGGQRAGGDERAPEAAPRAGTEDPGPAAGAPSPPSAPGAQDEGGHQAAWREWADPEVEEHFVPPDPPPLPAGDLHFWGILIGLLGGPLILFLAHGLGVLDDPLWTWLGLGLSLGGFALLVLRLPTHRDDDPSGGARV